MVTMSTVDSQDPTQHPSQEPTQGPTSINPTSASLLGFLYWRPMSGGEIVVTGSHVVPHYLDSGDDAATKIRAGARIWHRTGDRIYLDLAHRWAKGTAILFAVACSSNNNLQDLKTGQLVGATPWRQQIALLAGVTAATLPGVTCGAAGLRGAVG